jgi:hypothetical protein
MKTPEVQLNNLRKSLQRTRNTVNPIRIANRATRTYKQLNAIAFKNRGIRYKSYLPTQAEGFSSTPMTTTALSTPAPMTAPLAPSAQTSAPTRQMPPSMRHMNRPSNYHRPRPRPPIVYNYNTYGSAYSGGWWPNRWLPQYQYIPVEVPVEVPVVVEKETTRYTELVFLFVFLVIIGFILMRK